MTIRITDLNELSVDLSQSDVLPIVDVSAADTKQIKTSSLIQVGISGAPNAFIDLAKLNQNSATKLGAAAFADTGVASGVYGSADTVPQFVVNDKGLITTATGVPIAITTTQVTGLAAVATSGTYASLSGTPTLGTLSSQDAGSVLISGGTISGIVDLAIADGGTGASTASGARSNLGLVIGTDVQAYDAGLASIASLSTSADQILYLTGSDTYATSPLPSYARELLASGNSATDARTALGLGSLATKSTVATADIADTGVASGVYGGAATVPQFVVNDKGLITTATGVPIAIAASSVAGLAAVATSGTYQSLAGLPTLGTLASQDAGSIVVSGGTISGVTFISGNVTVSGGTISGITDLAIEDGGTGASTAADARTNLGLTIGTDVQAYSTVLSGVAGAYGTADNIAYASASGVVATTTITSLGRTIVSQTAASGIRNELSLGSMALQNASSVAISGGTISGITDLAIEDGGTGASSAADARTNLGLAIGSDVQAYDAGLASIAGLSTSADQILYLTGSDAYATSPLPAYSRGFLASGNSASDARAVLGLGSLATKSTIAAIDVDDSSITGDKVAANTLVSGNYGVESVGEAALGPASVTAVKIAPSGVTAEKLADNSSTIVGIGAPISVGEFIGQQYQDTATNFQYTWDGDSWERHAAINDISFADSTPIAFSVAYPDDYSAVITTTLETQSPNTIFAGPASGTASTPSFRTLQPVDLPVATDSAPGAVQPGNGLSVNAAGVINHSNVAVAGTYAGPVTIDAEGHIVTAQATLQASDIPDLDASKITTGTFDSAFLAENSVTASQLADYGIAQVSESAPTPEFAGQWWINPNDRSAYIWVGEVSPVPNGYWLNLGYGSPTQINLRFGGTYNASGNVVESINSYGIEAGLAVGQGLPVPNTSNNGIYLIVTSSGVGTVSAPAESLSIGNWVLSQGVGASWTKVNLASAVAGISDQDVLVDGSSLIPAASGVASQEALNELVWARVQVATSSAAGIVRGSSEIIVASGTGTMSLGTVDDGLY